MDSVSTRSGDTQLGMSLDLSNQGRPRPDVAVRVHVGLAHPGDPLPGLEHKLDEDWKKVELTPDKGGATGTFRMDLPQGDYLAFLRVTPHVSAKVEGDGLPVDVAMTDGSRTLARNHETARLTTLSLRTMSPEEPVVLRKGRWTEVVYAVTNLSRSAYPKAQIQAEIEACAADSDDVYDPDACPAPGAQSVTTALHTQWHDGTGWKEVTAPDDGSLLAGTLTMPFGTLPADSTRKVRFRFAGGEQLDSDVRRLTITARTNGEAVGASKRSVGFASPFTFDIR
ncbi:hypothetical protein AB0D14_18615 [Streptomyces sp. NPDC048484]|uniref:hypothetical protein n=1 Tax=Streptomyces sp. NPDC048484 TaxID=3155146 RepID=UPI003414DFD9